MSKVTAQRAGYFGERLDRKVPPRKWSAKNRPSGYPNVSEIYTQRLEANANRIHAKNIRRSNYLAKRRFEQACEKFRRREARKRRTKQRQHTAKVRKE